MARGSTCSLVRRRIRCRGIRRMRCGPQIYRNIFQAYGTYVFPLGKGLTVDFGKWASSLGIEGNYTKDQVNYSRSFFFDYLPFYHMGVRASYKVNDKLARTTGL